MSGRELKIFVKLKIESVGVISYLL